MKKVLMFLILAFSLALVACGGNGSNGGDSGNVPSGQATYDITAADVPDKAGYDKSGYGITGSGDKLYIYKKDGKIMAFTLADAHSSHEYTVSYDGTDNPTITSSYGQNFSGDKAKDIINKLNNKERVTYNYIHGSGNDSANGSNGSNGSDSGNVPSGQATYDIAAANIPDKAGYDKSGYGITGSGDKLYIYKKDGKIMAFTLADAHYKNEYTVSYDGTDNPTITSSYGQNFSGDKAKDIISKLNNKERVSYYDIHGR